MHLTYDALRGNDGRVSHEDLMRCIEMTGQEVLPRLREIAKELGLADPFEAGAPVSAQHPGPARARSGGAAR